MLTENKNRTQAELMNDKFVNSFMEMMRAKSKNLVTFSPEEVSEIIKMNVITVRVACTKGIIKAVKVGRSWRVSLDELERIQKQGVSIKKKE